MTKKTPAKLTLNKDSIRGLSAGALQRVAAGMIPESLECVTGPTWTAVCPFATGRFCATATVTCNFWCL